LRLHVPISILRWAAMCLPMLEAALFRLGLRQPYSAAAWRLRAGGIPAIDADMTARHSKALAKALEQGTPCGC